METILPTNGKWIVTEDTVTFRMPTSPERVAELERVTRQGGYIELGNECWSPVPYRSQSRFILVIGWVDEIIYERETIEAFEHSPHLAFMSPLLPHAVAALRQSRSSP